MVDCKKDENKLHLIRKQMTTNEACQHYDDKSNFQIVCQWWCNY